MKLINPKVEFITEPNPLKRIELCGRVCYKSEDRITDDSARKFVENLIKRGHTSVLEHARIRISMDDYRNCHGHVKNEKESLPYGIAHRISRHTDTDNTWININVRDYLAIGGSLEHRYHANADDYMTVRFVCDRGISHELVRHRGFSFSQESTRYVNYKDGVQFIRPLPFAWAETIVDKFKNDYSPDDFWTEAPIAKAWRGLCIDAEGQYQKMIERGASPQEARSVLPNSLKTEIIMTGTFAQWHEMLKLRLDKAAHPQMQYLMQLMVEHPECPKELESWRVKVAPTQV